MMHFSWANCV